MTVQLKRFTDEQRIALTKQLSTIISNPYSQYYEFKDEVKDLKQTLPDFIHQLCDSIVNDRKIDERAHFIRNCPIDINVEKFDPTNPSVDKYQKKKTFIGETFLQVFAELTGTPIFRYTTDSNFFKDVYGLIQSNPLSNEICLQKLVWHNDATYNKIMPDYITLLGMRAYKENKVYTSLIDSREIMMHLDQETQRNLRRNYYATPAKNCAFDSNSIEEHPILIESKLRYCSSVTQCAPESPVEAKDALIALETAIMKSSIKRFIIGDRDLLNIPNKHYLHNREAIQVNNIEEAYHRWLLKTSHLQNPDKVEGSKVFFVHRDSIVIKN